MANENENDFQQEEQNTGTQQEGGEQQEQQREQQQPSFGNDDLDAALGKYMENTDARKGPPTQGTQQQGAGQQPAQQGDGRDRDAQGRFVPQGQQSQTPQRGQQQSRGQQPTQDHGTQQIPAQARRFGANYWSDERGNIHDTKGNLIAPSGAGHAQFRKIYPYIQSLEQEASTASQRLKTFEEANALARAANLSLEDQGAALQLMVHWRKDPVSTIKTLLQHAQNNGIDVSSIAQGGGGVDANTLRSAVKELLTEALSPFQPIIEQQQRQREQDELMSAVVQEHDAFLQEFPDAEIHQEVIANVMKDRNVSAREAYMTLRAYTAEQRLDWSKPLPQQLQARQQQRGGAPNGGGNNRPMPDMSGRNGGGSANGTVREGSRHVAGANDSWDSIAEATFQQFGLTRG